MSWRLPAGRVVYICILWSALLLLVGPAAFSAGGLPKQDATVRGIIAKVLKAYGGGKALENIATVYAEDRIAAFAFGVEGTYVRYFERGRRLRVDINYPNSSELRILNGSRGYEDGLGVTGDRFLAMAYQYKQLDLPYGLLHDDCTIAYKGRGAVEGAETEVLGLSDREGPPMKVYVDTSNHYIVKVSGDFSMGGSAMVLSAVFSDFRRVNGTFLPFRITNFAGGQKIGETIIEKYEVNVPMLESLFEPR